MTSESPINRRESWKSIVVFLFLVTILSAPFHYALVNLYPSRIYVGGLMWCPALAAIITLKIKNRPFNFFNRQSRDWRFVGLSYFVPTLYVLITYILLWVFDLVKLANTDTIKDWGAELGLIGIGSMNPNLIGVVAVFLLGTVGVIRSMATTLGEEIGWRGFFIYELRKVLSFTGVTVISGVVWTAWHWPVIVYFSQNVLLEFVLFFVVILSMSFVMNYYMFKTNNLWTAVLFHAVSNVYIQKILPGITTNTIGMEHWSGENGVMFAAVTLVFGIYYWRKAVLEKL